MTRDELERLSSKELHDRAVSHAVGHGDVKFLWTLIKSVPAAEAAAGHMDEARSDVVSLSSLLTDVVHAGEEDAVADALRPLYIDYLEQHSHG
jgi:hypothetical protein